jgi:ribose 5-phosphate isomerase A
VVIVICQKTEGTHSTMDHQDRMNFKRIAAEKAVEFVEPGMVVGLGHGSTVGFALRHIALLLGRGELSDILGIPCSRAVKREAMGLGIPLTTLEEHQVIDITIDGADEIDPDLDVIKGGGGALLREKIVAQASRREIIVVDESKFSPVLGTRWPVPVEVISFGWKTQVAYLEAMGARVTVRHDDQGRTFRTDQKNIILDCDFGPISYPNHLAGQLTQRVGIVEHGLFLKMATDAIVAGRDGTRHLTRDGRPLERDTQ